MARYKKRITKVVGQIDETIAKKWGIEEYCNCDIVQSLDLYIHIAKHATEYLSVDSMNYTLDNVELILKNPDYVFYNLDKVGLEYYKNLLENVRLVVTINGKEPPYISSIYPTTEETIKNRKNKEKKELQKIDKKNMDKLIEKFKYKGNGQF